MRFLLQGTLMNTFNALKAIKASALVVALCSIAHAQKPLQVPGEYATIQAAIDVALPGDTVVVSPGTYVEHLNFLGKDIRLLSTGGAAVTTIDGDDAGTVVLFENDESPDTLLDGFTITGGRGTIRPGGGIYCGGSAPTIQNCVIVRNRGSDALGGAGGIACSYGAPLIRNCVIRANVGAFQAGHNNQAAGGLGTRWASFPVVLDSVFEDNLGSNGGPGALQCFPQGRVRVLNTRFSGNVGGASEEDCQIAGPGAVRTLGDQATFIDCDFENNRGGNGKLGAGAMFIGSAGVSIDRCVFVDNVGSHCSSNPNVAGGPGVLRIERSSPIIRFSEFRSNQGGPRAPGAIQTDDYAGPDILDSSFIENRGGASNANTPPGAGAIRFTGAGQEVDLISRCVFRGNVGGDGQDTGGPGALQLERKGFVADCLFEANRGGFGASDDGGAGVLWTRTYAEVALTGCRIQGNFGGPCEGAGNQNSARGGAGAMRLNGMTAKLISCILSDNEGGSAPDFGPGAGAIENEGGLTQILNCTVAGNRSGVAPGNPRPSGMYVVTGSQAEVVNSIFWNDPGDLELAGSVLTVRRSLVRGGFSGPNNLDLDPRFVDEAGGDFHLRCGSPCHDSATLNGVSLTSTDVDGDPRVLGGTLDIGADEYNAPGAGSSYCTATVNSTGSAAAINALGCNALSDGILPLRAGPVPETFGAFFYGADSTQVPFANGFRCVGGAVYRLAFQPITTGVLRFDLDYSTPPRPGGQILAGSTWNFQAYYRDPQAGGAMVNLSDGLQITFVP